MQKAKLARRSFNSVFNFARKKLTGCKTYNFSVIVFYKLRNRRIFYHGKFCKLICAAA